MSIGDRLKALREDRDLKQEDVAKYMDVDRSTVGKWESSPSKPNPEMIVKLANFYGVTTDYILGNTVPPSFSDSNTIESKETSSSDKKLSNLTEDEIISLAAHQLGHEGELSDYDKTKIRLAIQLALMKDNKK